jgi:hypothetical protein
MIPIISILILIAAFSVMLYKTYKTKRTQNISYYLLSFLLLIETIALYMLLGLNQQHNQLYFTSITLLASIAIIYFMIGTLYILYVKHLYADQETIEKRLEEKDIINISKIENIC